MAKKNRRDLSKEKFWRRVIARQRRSKLSVRGFCRREGVQENSFYFWRRAIAVRDNEIGRQTGGLKAATNVNDVKAGHGGGLFVPVRLRVDDAVVGEAGTNNAGRGGTDESGVEVVLAAGRLVRVRAGFDVATLRQVVAALEIETTLDVGSGRNQRGGRSC